MASWRLMNERSARIHRWLALARIEQRALSECTGAQAALWLSRLAAFGFAIVALYMARLLPAALDAVPRFALVAFSWCAGLAALSAAGPGPARALAASRGLLLGRGIAELSASAERPLMLALWICRRIGPLALLVLIACFALSDRTSLMLAGVARSLGAALYVLGLAAGLGLLASACHALGRTRGQALLLASVWVPEVFGAVWPGLPTVAGGYRRLLDLCLGLGA